MTRKHFEAIAAAVAAEKRLAGGASDAALQAIVARLIGVFKATNPNFNADRFWAACGF